LRSAESKQRRTEFGLRKTEFREPNMPLKRALAEFNERRAEFRRR
jgi:hypothetical protein